jgi:hypothetical protein
MALVIEQEPAYNTLAAGQKIIYVISEDTGIMLNQQLVKVNAAVGVYRNNNQTDQVHYSTYSSTPNNTGVAMFDFGRVIENYVKPQRNGILSTTPSAASEFQTVSYNDRDQYHSLHNIDKFCYSREVVNYVAVTFTIEFLGGDPNNPDAVGENAMIIGGEILYVFNGVVYEDDELTYSSGLNSYDFGLDLDDATNKYIMNDANSKFLTDAPTTLHARVEDYGTVAFFNNLKLNNFSFATTGQPDYGIDKIQYEMFDSSNASLGTFTVGNRMANGGWSGIWPDGDITTPDARPAQVRYLFHGYAPANLRATKPAFETEITNGALAYYTFYAKAQDGSTCSKTYRVNIIKDCLYESFRLAWLNKYGAWDYYTFNKKSVRTLTSTRTQYHKLDGTWNDSHFNLNTNKGGKKTYKTATTEKIRLNSDYMSDEEAQWIEQLMTSNEILIVKEYFVLSGSKRVINRFTEPVTLTTNTFTKKTRVNDKLVQYSFEIEKSNPIKSQGA